MDCFVLFYIHIATRRVHIAGITTNPDRVWLAQQARNACIFFNDQPRKAEFLIHDADGKFTPQFVEILKSDGVEQVKLPIRSPNLNAFAERWVQSIKHECLNHFIVFGENHMRYLVEEYAAHYHAERPHQSLGNNPLESTIAMPDGEAACRVRLGGLIKHYYRKAG